MRENYFQYAGKNFRMHMPMLNMYFCPHFKLPIRIYEKSMYAKNDKQIRNFASLGTLLLNFVCLYSYIRRIALEQS